MKSKNIELLSPAGDENAFKAAINAGATAIYFGLPQFSARTRATNISVEQAKILLPIAKSHGVKTYLTINTLLLDEELKEALNLISQIVDFGLDALIVQDLGALKVFSHFFPTLEIHGSTQMTTHNLLQAEFLATQGVSQINLSRELSLDQIKTICDFLQTKNIVAEVFVHGAYCISYSGQCYLSGYLYGKQGNRGSCVQPCRRQYSAKENSNLLLKNFYPFHLKDNCAFSVIDELIKAGATSLKIEGRIKSAEYVWCVTKAYKDQIENILNCKPIQKSSLYLSGVVNRDFSTHYLNGIVSDQMFSAGEKDKSLLFSGNVVSYTANSKNLVVKNSELKKGDKITIKENDGTFVCTGEILSVSNQKNGLLNAELKITNKLAKKILKGQEIYRSTSLISENELNSIIKSVNLVEKKLKIQLFGNFGEKLKAIFTVLDDSNKSIEVFSNSVLAKANNEGLTQKSFAEKLGRLGQTGFILGEIDSSFVQSQLFLPLSELNEMRRNAIALLKDEKSPKQDFDLSIFMPKQKHIPPKKNQMVFYCDSIELAESLNNQIVIFELPLNIKNEQKDFVLKNKNIIPAFNPILFDDDLQIALEFLQELSKCSEKPTILAENTGIAFAAKKLGINVILGQNLNITNSFSLLNYQQNFGALGFFPSQELSSSCVANLQIAENIQVFYPLFTNDLLMQSRQCLLHNATKCSKSQVDKDCILNCQKSVVLQGAQGEKIRAIKRKGFYSSLYPENIVSNAKDFDVLKNIVDYWVCDLRFMSLSEAQKAVPKALNFDEKTFAKTCERNFFIDGGCN